MSLNLFVKDIIPTRHKLTDLYSESLQYVLESVPIVDRAFVHVDYASYNLPTHMDQQQND